MGHLSVCIDRVPSLRIKGGVLLFFSIEPADVFIKLIFQEHFLSLSAVLKGKNK